MNDQTDLQSVNRHQWLTLKNSLFPGASDESIKMVLSYCVARGLDPMKKPCHIVPMRVKDAETGDWRYRDVVMPGIYELRTTAQKTGEYVGQDEPIFGPSSDYKGVDAPESCKIIVHRLHTRSGHIAKFVGLARFTECVGTKKGGEVNDRWSRAPYQMLEKCAEAAALRKAFPDELGGEYAFEEMAGQTLDTGPATKPETREPEPIKDVSPETAVPEPRPGPRAGPAPKLKDVTPPDDAEPPVSKGQATVEGPPVSADPEKKINKTQAGLLVDKAIKAGIREADLCAHFGIADIRQLPQDCMAIAKEWIKEHGGGG